MGRGKTSRKAKNRTKKYRRAQKAFKCAHCANCVVANCMAIVRSVRQKKEASFKKGGLVSGPYPDNKEVVFADPLKGIFHSGGVKNANIILENNKKI